MASDKIKQYILDLETSGLPRGSFGPEWSADGKYVPYTGASGNVDLGEHTLSASNGTKIGNITFENFKLGALNISMLRADKIGVGINQTGIIIVRERIAARNPAARFS